MSGNDIKFMVIEEGATADYVFDAYGRTLDELFANCAEACFCAMTDIDKVELQKELNILVEGETIEDLLYNFIAELIYLKDVEKIFLSKYDVEIDDEKSALRATLAGETIDYDKHVIKTDVKAVTYHGLKITEDDDGFTARMILDI